MIRQIGVLIMGTLISGCLFNRAKVNDPQVASRAAAIKVGVTRGIDVPRLLKADPTMRMPGKDRVLYGFNYSDTKTCGLMLLIFNFSRTTSAAQTLYVETDSQTDIVTSVYIPEREELEWRFWPFDR